MTVLVTGGAGLIGSHVVDQLRGRGMLVRVLDALVEPTHQGRPDWLRDDVDYVIGDVRDPEVLATALKDVRILVHLAAHGGFAPGSADYFDVNVTAYARLLDVARDVDAPLRRAVVASSQAVYGEGAGRCQRDGLFHPAARAVEDLTAGRWEVLCPACKQPGSPVPTAEGRVAARSPYAVSKLCLEDVAVRLGREQGIDTTVLRFALTYGRRQSASNPYCGIIPMFSGRMLRGEPVLIFEDGQQLRDYIHVSDVAAACLHAIDDPRTVGSAYNVGTGTGTKLLDLVDLLAQLWGVSAKVKTTGWFRPGDMRHLVTDALRLNALGWEPKVALAEGLADYVAWMRDRPWPPSTLNQAVGEMLAAGVIVERR